MSLFPRAAAACLAVVAVNLACRAADWIPGNGFRALPVAPAPGHAPGFTLLPPSVTGIQFSNAMPEWRYKTNQILLNGSGVAAGDIDGDGWCDLYFCRLHGPNVLYRNLGNWHFEDITSTAGVVCPNIESTAAAFADLDGDGDLDLVVNSLGGGTHIFLNNGKGQFTELTAKAPLNIGHGASSLAIGDLDGDGFLDIYIANYRPMALMDMPNTRFMLKKIGGRQIVTSVNGRPATDPDITNRFIVTAKGGVEEMGEPDMIYRNVGGTNFVPWSFTDGSFVDEDGKALTHEPFDWGLSVMIRDINQDGLPDIYVCNDFNSPDRIWINKGHGKFRALPRLAMRKGSMFSMGVDFADINRDGFDDFLLLDMLSPDRVRRLTTMGDRNAPVPIIGMIANRPEYMMNTLFLNRGDGTYAEIGQLAGLSASDWSWCPIFIDVDLDGWEDVLISNGHERAARDFDVIEKLRLDRLQRQMTPAEILDARKIFPRLATPNFAFHNNRDLTFTDMSQQWGFNLPAVSHGMAAADLDNDGDLDIVVNNLHAPAAIYRNEASAPRLAVRLKGRGPNTAGIGAKIKCLGGPVPQQQEIICGGRYVSCDQAMRMFAAGSETNSLTIEVAWRSGTHTVITDAKPNHIYEIYEDSSSSTRREDTPAQGQSARETAAPKDQVSVTSIAVSSDSGRDGIQVSPFFEDVSPLLNHTHIEELYDDFVRQPLLPHKLSQLGPGVSWFDIDHDGWDDAIIGSGKGGPIAIFRNDGHGRFERLHGPFLDQPVEHDQTTILGWERSKSESLLLAGFANYEDGDTNASVVGEYNLVAKMQINRLPGFDWSAGPLAMADIDNDGDLDLFVGGRVKGGAFPAPVGSAIFRNVNGQFSIDNENTRGLAAIGLVSGAVFSDLDGDGLPDLVLACQWGSIRVFHNDKGHFTEQTQALGLDRFKGWWNGVATGDFDGDGRLDIVASNWGRNSRYEAHRTRPLRLYYGNLAGDGSLQFLEAHFDTGLQKFVPELGLPFVARMRPVVQSRYPTHASFARASIEEILGEQLPEATVLEANWLDSTVFLNRSSNFVAHPLSAFAQFAPAFGVCVGDFDGDGHEDVFLAQNFFASQPEVPRYDGGVGLWLRGTGAGDFTPVSPLESGIRAYGEQRGAALADYDGDGRIDLLLGQNAQETKLFHNQRARPGLRVRLVGPPSNPRAVGALIRLANDRWQGPAREIQSGAGYWSQNSAVQVLCATQTATHVVVRWPDGKTSKHPIAPGARETTIDWASSTR